MIVVFKVKTGMHVQWRACCRVVSAGVDQEGALQLLQSMLLGPAISFYIKLSGSSGFLLGNKVRVALWNASRICC